MLWIDALAALGVGGAYLYIVSLAARGSITVGDVVMYTSTVFYGGAAIRGLIQAASALTTSSLEVRAFFDYLEDATDERRQAPPRDAPPRAFRDGPEWRLRNVAFTYAGQSRPAVDGVTLTIGPGEKVAIVGFNGAGKSTLMKLMLRLLEPSQGEIEFRGRPLRDWDIGAFRRTCGVVFQDFAKFKLTLRENIASGDVAGADVADGARVLRAAESADVAEIADRAPRGYDTQLGKEFDNGLELSGGQWNRVALARALIRDGTVLWLDEPSAALDARAEQARFERLLSCARDTTAIIISHRLAITPAVDRIIVLDGGQVIEDGSHAELMQRDGILPAYVVSLLSQCRDFRTIEAHLQSVSGQLGVGASVPESIRAVFTKGEQSGYLASERVLRDGVRGAAGLGPGLGLTSERARIASVGIVTATRAGSMERCLGGVIDHQRHYGRPCNVTIVDDAPDADVRRARRVALADVATRSQARIVYAGAEEKRQFVGELAKAGIDPSLAAFALFDDARCGFSAGANRNALLLHHAGDVFFQVDDDIVWQVASPREARDELCFTQGHNPNRLHYFHDQQRALDASTFIDCDVLARHESMLGRTVAECAQACAGLAVGDATHMSDNLLRLALGGAGRVAVTQNGLVGDSGFQNCWPYLLLRGPLRDDLHQSEQTYRLATSSRTIAQTVLAPTISDGAFCVSYALGLDHRRLLPPFFPVQRNGDGVFGALLRACCDEALFGHVPIQLVHAPPEQRAYPVDSLWRAPRVETSAIILQLIRAFDFGPVTDARRRMRMLGRHLCDIASVAPQDFLAFARDRAWANLRNQISMFQALFKEYGRKPDY